MECTDALYVLDPCERPTSTVTGFLSTFLLNSSFSCQKWPERNLIVRNLKHETLGMMLSSVQNDFNELGKAVLTKLKDGFFGDQTVLSALGC